MVDVRINHKTATVIATGHANSPRNEDGRDMVCCMVSTLVQALLVSCLALPGVMADYTIEPGDVYLRVSRSGKQERPVGERLRMFEDGIRMLEEKYPDCVRIV